ncbi:hypothetical protein HI914_02042 [Erysiphe necator]|nr:hypothetical protein HI914_02042 [Erysiphe necator]
MAIETGPCLSKIILSNMGLRRKYLTLNKLAPLIRVIKNARVLISQRSTNRRKTAQLENSKQFSIMQGMYPFNWVISTFIIIKIQ